MKPLLEAVRSAIDVLREPLWLTEQDRLLAIETLEECRTVLTRTPPDVTDPNLAALIVAVRALDPAAADDEPYDAWDRAKWDVFNAAVRFVRETVRSTPVGDAGSAAAERPD